MRIVSSPILKSRFSIGMSCTRAKNSPGNYCLEQRGLAQTTAYDFYRYSQYGHAWKPAMPTPGVTPSHMPRNTLSNNPVEIETVLFGIGSCNLVQPQPPTKPELHDIPEVSYFERVPLIMPESFTPQAQQRPFPIPE